VAELPPSRQGGTTTTTLTPAPAGYPIKLVRDNTPTILNASGEPGDLWYEQAPADLDYYMRLLRLKLGEEATEFMVDGGWGELRDVLAVVEALAVALGGSLDLLIQALHDDPRGGFLRAVVMYGRHEEFDGRSERR
jgi:predicted house-cleaning noncanonical NTP pyrophosphatase (MazG superfamily)